MSHRQLVQPSASADSASWLTCVFPSDESLGYCQASEADSEWNAIAKNRGLDYLTAFPLDTQLPCRREAANFV